MIPLPLLVFLSLFFSLTALSRETPSFIELKTIEGRTWLVDASGQPFFAHGVTHLAYGHDEELKPLAAAIRNLGFNSLGYGCPDILKSDWLYPEGRNYLVPMSTYRIGSGSFSYVDIFDPAEQQRIETIIRRMCETNRDNPNLIGYFWTDLAAWPLEGFDAPNWVEFIRSLPEESPGQQAYQRFLETWEGDDPGQRDLAFLRLIAREYFRVCGEANRKYDPHHLIFGDRFAFRTIVPEVLEEMLPYVDAIAIQPPFNPGFPKAQFEEIHKMTGKPILICDFAIRFEEEGKEIRGWRPQPNAQAAGEKYTAYIKAALDTPYILGSFWCTPVNSYDSFLTDGKIKQGIFGEGIEPRPDLNQALIKLNQHIQDRTPRM